MSILFCLLLLWVVSCKKTDAPVVTPTPTPATKSAAKVITAFAFNGLTPALTATIDVTAKTISATVPAGTDVTKLVPTSTLSDKATVSPASGVAQDFSKAVTYTVTAEDGSTQTYTATVTIEKPVIGNSFTDVIQKAISLELIDKVKGSGVTVYGGNTPPSIEGTYKMADCIISDASDKSLVSRKIADITYNFSGYNSSQQSIIQRLKQTGGDNGSVSNVFYVSGSGNGFSVFRNFISKSGSGLKFYEVFSGEITADGVKNLTYLQFRIDEQTKEFADKLIFIDKDGLAQKQTSF